MCCGEINSAAKVICFHSNGLKNEENELLMKSPEIFISYSWKTESLKVVEQIDTAFKNKGISIIRDERNIAYKGLIKEFMERLGRGKYIILVISEDYLKSENCMFELLQIAKHEKFYDRVFPVLLDSSKIFTPKDRIQYVHYWEAQIDDLEKDMRNTKSLANLHDIYENLNLYSEIRNNIARLTGFLTNVNTYPIKNYDFTPLFDAIESRINQERKGFKSSESSFRMLEKTSEGEKVIIETDSKYITIGRSPNSDIQLTDDTVSWEHGNILFTENEYIYRHVSKTNPTQIRRHNEELLLRKDIKTELSLKNNDRIIIGASILIVHFNLYANEFGYTTTKEEDS